MGLRGRKVAGFLVTERLREVLRILSHAQGPLTTPQLFACAKIFLPSILSQRTGRRLFFRVLERCVRAGWLRHEPFPGERWHVWFLTPSGAEFCVQEGIVPGACTHRVEEYRAWPYHARLVREVYMAFSIGKFLQDNGQAQRWLDRLGWEENVVLDLPGGDRIEPDARLHLVPLGGEDTYAFPVEVDRGTEVVSSSRNGWVGKVERYMRLAAESDGKVSGVLVAGNSGRRVEHLIEATVEVLGNRPPAFLFTTADQLTPETIGERIWRRVPGNSGAPVSLPEFLQGRR